MTASTTQVRDVLGGAVAWRAAGSPESSGAVFLHGLGGNRFSWEPQLAGLSDERFARAWEVPGYGDSPGLITTLPDLAAVAADWIRSTGTGPVDVVGLSFGGMVAQHLALDHPDVVRTLALLDTSPAFGLDGVTMPEEWLASRVTPLNDQRSAAEKIEGVVSGLVGPNCSDDVRQSVVDSMQAIPEPSLDAACNALVRHDTRARLPQVHVPTLVAVGEFDTETPLSYADVLASLIPGARLVVIPGVGHISNLEAPDLVNDLLRELWSEGAAA